MARKNPKLIVTVQFEDDADHLNIKQESRVVTELESVEQGWFYAGILMGLFFKWKEEDGTDRRAEKLHKR